MSEALKRRINLKKDIPYLRLVHDTRGGPTDREIEIIQQEADDLGHIIDNKMEAHINMTLDIWEHLEQLHHPERKFHRQYWKNYLLINM